MWAGRNIKGRWIRFNWKVCCCISLSNRMFRDGESLRPSDFVLVQSCITFSPHRHVAWRRHVFLLMEKRFSVPCMTIRPPSASHASNDRSQRTKTEEGISMAYTMAVGIPYTFNGTHRNRAMMSHRPPLHRILESSRQWRLGNYSTSITS